MYNKICINKRLTVYAAGLGCGLLEAAVNRVVQDRPAVASVPMVRFLSALLCKNCPDERHI